MRPETREVIEKLLTDMETIKGTLDKEEDKRHMDEFMFCTRNCYTEKETEMHMTRKFPNLKPSDVIIGFDSFMDMIDKESKQTYLINAEECASLRSVEKRDDSEEAKNNQDEASTSQPPTQ